MNIRQLFINHVAQTSPSPIALHITKAEGNYLIDTEGKKYLDLIGGISVCNVGHGNAEVIAAVKVQAEQYMHLMVYGELIQTPQVAYAQLLTQHLPESLNSVYFTNSGAEAVEGAIKLSRKITNRTDIIACNKSYHGSTTGALSLIGDEYWRNAFRPLIPGIWHYEYNSPELIEAINEQTACVVLETVQAEAGVIAPDKEWINAVRHKCAETGTLMILDEIQCGFGRTGTLWGFEHYDISPDILLLGKALGGGMPLGAFITSRDNMNLLTENPVLGHITTFGGHPVSCAAGMAAMNYLLRENIIEGVARKGKLFKELLEHHPSVRAVRSNGLLIAAELESQDVVMQCLSRCLEQGLFSDWFLFAPQCIRIAPPLTLTEGEVKRACDILISSLPK